MQNTGYQPNRSQHLAMASLVREKYGIDGTVIIHYVLVDTPLKLYVQAEVQRNVLFEGVKYKVISFERVEV